MTRLRPILASLGLVLLLLATAPFAWHSATRGLDYADAGERAGSRLFHADAPAPSAALYAHMVVGGALTVLAPLQLIGPIRRRAPRLHRLNGRVVVALSLLTAAGGLAYIAAKGTIGGPPMSAGFALYGLLLGGAAIRTAQMARRRDPSHPDWAARLVVLALGSWMYRVGYGLWYAATGGAGSVPELTGPFDRVMVVAFYALPLLAVEAWRRRPDRRAAPSAA